MLELIQKIKTYTEAGIILEHMYLFDLLETNARALESIKSANNSYIVFEDGEAVSGSGHFRNEVDKMRKDNK